MHLIGSTLYGPVMLRQVFAKVFERLIVHGSSRFRTRRHDLCEIVRLTVSDLPARDDRGGHPACRSRTCPPLPHPVFRHHQIVCNIVDALSFHHDHVDSHYAEVDPGVLFFLEYFFSTVDVLVISPPDLAVNKCVRKIVNKTMDLCPAHYCAHCIFVFLIVDSSIV